MTDIALLPGPDGTTADLAVVNGDLATDDGLLTAILVSLLTDRMADPADTLPLGSADRRGWWGDAYADPLPDGSPDLIGCKLWLRRRALATQQTQLAIEADISDGLAWMLATNLAADVSVSSSYVALGSLSVTIQITQIVGNRQAVQSFDAIWNNTLGSLLF